MGRKVRKLKMGLAALILCGILLPPACAKGEVPRELSQLYAHSAVLMDGDSGRILYGKKEEEALPMASTTKIMTCILALELGEPDEICRVSANAQAQPQVHLGMREGETYYLKDLLYSMMLESHNDSAVCVAEHIGGSVEAFADLMNRKAEEIGCRDTHYVTPNGLDGEDEGGIHSTTAADLARIMRYCLMESEKREAFLEITRTGDYRFQEISGARSVSCVNRNALLTMMDGALSGKTGFTSKAGYCYVGAARRDGETLIGAVLACGWPGNKGYKWSDMKKMLEYGFENYDRKTIDLEKLELPAVQVTGGIRKEVRIGLDPKEAAEIWGIGTDGQEKNFKPALLVGAEEEVKIRLKTDAGIRAPVEAGEKAGELLVEAGGERLASFPLRCREDVEKPDFAWCLGQITEEYFSFLGGAERDF